MKVALNGSIVEASEAVIPVYDHGFLYGLGLFETFRTYGGSPYLLERHLDRLLAGCKALGIRYEPSLEDVKRLLTELLAASSLTDGYVRLTVSAGAGELGLPSGDYEQPTELIMVKELPRITDEALLRGKELRLLGTSRNTPEGDIRFKSLHYMNNIIAKRELQAAGASPGAEGLMLTRDGWLAEGIVSNVFFARDGIVYTPDIETGILPGITRKRVLELASLAGVETKEGLFRWKQLLSADEVWLTNSIQELVPVTLLTDSEGNSVQVGAGGAGPLTRKLLAMYREDTGDC